MSAGAAVGRRGLARSLSVVMLWALFSAAVPLEKAAAIVNGVPVSPAQFAAETPWAVVVASRSGPGICTGTLIAPRYVLTAGHCTSSDVVVYYGSPDRSSARRVAVREAIRHPDFRSSPMAYDLGLLRLARPLRVRPLPIPGRAEAWSLLQSGRSATILGWGRTAAGGDWVTQLQQRTFTLRDLAIVGTGIVYTSDVTGPCGGDSGGPLVIRGNDGEPLLLGVASVTDGNLCARGGGAAAYTHVSSLLDFIHAHARDVPERLPPLNFGDSSLNSAAAGRPGAAGELSELSPPGILWGAGAELSVTMQQPRFQATDP